MRTLLICVLTISVSFVFSSCASSVIQVLTVSSPNCQTASDYLYYENDTLQVVYMFWDENGTMGVFIHNKSELPLYIDWKKCSFVVGESKNDYWDDATTTISSGSSISFGNAQMKGSASASYWFANFLNNTISGTSSRSNTGSLNWLQQSSGYSVSRLSKPGRITFIPPHATICQSAYALMSTGVPIGHSAFSIDTMVLVTGPHSPTHQSMATLNVVDFNRTNSPLRFRSYVTYSHDEQFRTEAHLDSYFYVSQLVQLPIEAFTAQPIAGETKDSKKNMWSSPSRFYIRTRVKN